MRSDTFLSLTLKVVIVHTVTYFLMGLLAFTLLDYAGRFADPAVATFMRQASDPWVASGPLFQVLRGLLFGIAFYPLREIVFARKHGWLVLWLVLVVVGILAPFGAAPSSIEGMIYTILPISFHVMGLPEVVIQAFLLAFLSHYWINHPEKKWLDWVLGVAFISVLLLSTVGVLAGLGFIPQTP
ncbi:MAG: hypothetical protein IPJ58_11150 [Ardenticatenia bacterium]|nr:hypothetical protein [Ardenticatenia bacterium]